MPSSTERTDSLLRHLPVVGVSAIVALMALSVISIGVGRAAPHGVSKLTVHSTCAEWDASSVARRKRFLSRVLLPEVRFERDLILKDVDYTCEQPNSAGRSIRHTLGTAVKG